MQSFDTALASFRPARRRSISFGAGLACCVALTLGLALVVSVTLQVASTVSSGSLVTRNEQARQMLKVSPPQD